MAAALGPDFMLDRERGLRDGVTALDNRVWWVPDPAVASDDATLAAARAHAGGLVAHSGLVLAVYVSGEPSRPSWDGQDLLADDIAGLMARLRHDRTWDGTGDLRCGCIRPSAARPRLAIRYPPGRGPDGTVTIFYGWRRLCWPPTRGRLSRSSVLVGGRCRCTGRRWCGAVSPGRGACPSRPCSSGLRTGTFWSRGPRRWCCSGRGIRHRMTWLGREIPAMCAGGGWWRGGSTSMWRWVSSRSSASRAGIRSWTFAGSNR